MDYTKYKPLHQESLKTGVPIESLIQRSQTEEKLKADQETARQTAENIEKAKKDLATREEVRL